VQLIKLVQQEVGMGHERVRAPRLVLAGAERKAALATLHAALATRPKLHPVSVLTIDTKAGRR
jgi:4-hydroxy-tetrahydrodipicolinate synthase